MSTAFRETFLEELGRLHQRGELKLTGEYALLETEAGWRAFLQELRAVNWVSFIQPPPQRGQTAAPVLKYLARYLSGGPISDSRIVSTDEEKITFMARAGEVSGGERQQIPITLTQLEFTRRWSLHVLPSGYTRTRRFGGWSNTNREEFLELFAKQLDAAEVPLAEGATDFGPPEDGEEGTQTAEDQQNESTDPCKTCGGSLIPHSTRQKPSWSIIMASGFRPAWYQSG